jgi:hypothetical protein
MTASVTLPLMWNGPECQIGRQERDIIMRRAAGLDGDAIRHVRKSQMRGRTGTPSRARRHALSEYTRRINHRRPATVTRFLPSRGSTLHRDRRSIARVRCLPRPGLGASSPHPGARRARRRQNHREQFVQASACSTYTRNADGDSGFAAFRRGRRSEGRGIPGGGQRMACIAKFRRLPQIMNRRELAI